MDGWPQVSQISKTGTVLNKYDLRHGQELNISKTNKNPSPQEPKFGYNLREREYSLPQPRLRKLPALQVPDPSQTPTLLKPGVELRPVSWVLESHDGSKDSSYWEEEMWSSALQYTRQEEPSV